MRIEICSSTCCQAENLQSTVSILQLDFLRAHGICVLAKFNLDDLYSDHLLVFMTQKMTNEEEATERLDGR
uniref:Uncharacterized protein n=1 Tax=Picea sitchensis TaxID=3332 RepID=D5ABX7_PICSI|nr:unknown [Picea sitchensis]